MGRFGYKTYGKLGQTGVCVCTKRIYHSSKLNQNINNEKGLVT